MKYDEAQRTPAKRLEEAKTIGRKLHQLRVAHGMTQSDVAARAGVSRSTAVLLEQGNESRTLSQILRYLHAMEPELTLSGLFNGESGAVRNFNNATRVQRVSKSSASKPLRSRGLSAKNTHVGQDKAQAEDDRPNAGKNLSSPMTPDSAKDKYDF